MAKKRTRKDKSEAKHPFLVEWDEASLDTSQNKPVKGKIEKSKKLNLEKTKKENKTIEQVELSFSGTPRHEIIRAVLIAVFILGIELVLYLTL